MLIESINGKWAESPSLGINIRQYPILKRLKVIVSNNPTKFVTPNELT